MALPQSPCTRTWPRFALAGAACLTFALAATTARAQEDIPVAPPLMPHWFQEKDSTGQFLSESQDPTLNMSVLEAAGRARKEFARALFLPEKWRYRILFRIMPATERPRSPLISASLDKELAFQVTLWPGEGQGEELLRALANVFLYEKILEKSPVWKADQVLPVIPLWLNEGLLQVVTKQDDKIWEKVVKRAYVNGHAPELAEVAGWKELSTDLLQRSWQQAFSYYLLQSIRRNGAEKINFEKWLNESGAPGSTVQLPQNLMSGEVAWRGHIAEASKRALDLVYSFAETSAQWDQLQAVTLPAKDKIAEVVTTLAELPAHRDHPSLPAVIEQKKTDLVNLELRAHFTWRPVIALERQALAELENPKAKKNGAEELGQQTLGATARLRKYYADATDYLNWYVVTKSPSSETSAFQGYFNLQHEIENFNARPNDPFRIPTLREERAVPMASSRWPHE